MKSHASMNRIYRLVWNQVLNAWVAVAETAKGRGKGSSRKLIAAALSLNAVAAMAGPQGGQVVAGAGAISQSGSTTTINQASQNLSLSWQSFNVAKPETVNFVQPSASAIAVNRIYDTNASQILGHLNANGQVYLINPNGILFGQGAQVNVGGLVASTLDLSDTSLNGNAKTFSGKGTGSVINQGSITAAQGGYVALLGNTVSNQGVITAQLGTVALGAGSAATLTFQNNSLVKMQVDQNTLASLAENKQLIQADGGQVIMSAGAKDALLAGVVNNSGVIEARTVQNTGGTITLLGDNVFQSGTADASGSSVTDNGGHITVNARTAALIDGALHADGAQGGQVSISAPHIGQSAAITAQGSSAAGGSITLNGELIVQSTGAQLNASSTQGNGGSVDVRAFKADGSGHLFSSGSVDVTGQHGGSVLLSADTVDLYAASVNASGIAGGGTVLIGGDTHGGNASVPNAQHTTLNAYTSVKADATQTGNGGKVIVWSDQHTSYAGAISAQGGANGGDGGFIEVSGKQTLGFNGSASAAAPQGQKGTLLLDPKNIAIETPISSSSGYLALTPPSSGLRDLFGTSVTVLSNNNIVVTAPNDSFAAASAGAAYLYNGKTGALISTLRGSTAYDSVSSSGITALSNGNYVVASQNWGNGSGAVTWGSGTTGVSGTVSASNSLVGSMANDQVGNATSSAFGSPRIAAVTALSNGNYVVASPYWSNGSLAGVGAVTWGDGTKGVSGTVSASNSLVGSTANDSVGNLGVTALSNGNYAVASPYWHNGSLANAGAVTWVSGTTGITGTVSASNSLVGSSADDYVGGVVSSSYMSATVTNGITALQSNGNYVVSSANWHNGSVAGAGAVTWGSGTTGITGTVSASNSLVGSTANDQVGSTGVTALSNGNYVVCSRNWTNGSVASAGAVTWGDGITGISGTVSVSNSLVGSTLSDMVGNGVTELSNGNYVVRSAFWNNGSVAYAGAATWGSGTSGITGTVSASNSLVGSTKNDQVGSSVTTLSNGNYVVISGSWHNGSLANAGAVTWGSGTTGVSGTVSASNSLVGSTANDSVGNQGVTALSNGNYVVASSQWNNGSVGRAGAVTWGSGTSGVTGTVSASNSLVGSTASDIVGQANNKAGVTALNNGNYVVASPTWANGSAAQAGAVTWGDGTTGIRGTVSASNSLVGSTANDLVGASGITALSNGNYVVGSQDWHNGSVTSAGAVTWGSGISGITGVVSASNSLVGSTASDQVGMGRVTTLSNGNYVVSSPFWNNGSVAYVGAVTWGDGTTGIRGTVSASNSLVGSTANDQVGSYGITELRNGNYVVSSQGWDNGSVAGAGAVTWGNGTTGIRGTVSASNSLVGSTYNDQLSYGGVTALSNGDFVVGSSMATVNGQVAAGALWLYHAGSSGTGDAVSTATFSTSASANSSITPASIKAILDGGTAVVLQANNDITVKEAITGSGTTGGALTLQAGRSINFNANITTANGNLTAIANDANAIAAQRDAGNGNIVIASGVTLDVGTGSATLVGQNFTNNSGASALATTGTGQWQVWSSDPAKDTRGGLAYDFKQYNATYGSTTAAQTSGNGFFYTLAPTVKASLSGTVSKTYDATINATLTAANYGVNGAVDGDTVTLSNPTSASFDTKNVGTLKTVSVSGITVASASNGKAKVYGYSTGGTASAAIGDITAAKLIITGITASNKVYDSTAAATLSGTATVSALGTDVVTVSGNGTGSFADKNAGTGKAITLSGYTLGGADAGNYTVSVPTSLVADITPKALTVSGITASDKVYDGTTAATVNAAQASYTGLIAGDVVSTTSVTGAFADKNVGNAKAVNLTANFSGADAGNYSVSAPTGLTASITPKALSVSGITASNKVYDGTTAATVNMAAASLNGLVSGDVLNVNATGTFADKNAATGKTVTLASSYSGTDVGNYAITDQASSTASITSKALSVSGIAASNKVYDGTTAATVNTAAASLTGLLKGDVLSVQASGTFSDKNVATAKTVTFASSYSGADVGNYSITDQASSTASISPATLTYLAAPTSFFAGQTPSGLSGSVTGFVSGDTQANASSGSLAWTSTVTATSQPAKYAIHGAGLSASNYVFVQASGNASALSLQPGTPPALVLNATTQLALNVVSPQVGNRPDMLSLSPTLTVTQGSSLDKGDTHTSTGADTHSGAAAAMNVAMNFGTNGPTLQIISGGMRLPTNLVNVNE